MNIKFIGDCVVGETSLDELKIICVSSEKYKTVDLCIKGNMYIPFAKIKLFDTNRFIDAKKSFECATALGEEIAKAFNNRKEIK